MERMEGGDVGPRRRLGRDYARGCGRKRRRILVEPEMYILVAEEEEETPLYNLN